MQRQKALIGSRLFNARLGCILFSLVCYIHVFADTRQSSLSNTLTYSHQNNDHGQLYVTEDELFVAAERARHGIYDSMANRMNYMWLEKGNKHYCTGSIALRQFLRLTFKQYWMKRVNNLDSHNAHSKTKTTQTHDNNLGLTQVENYQVNISGTNVRFEFHGKF